MNCSSIVFSDHAISQMFKRSISVDEIKQIIETGKIINEYPDDKPYPSFLLLGFANNRVIHLVLARNLSDDYCVVITAYEPSADIWERDFITKKK